MRPKKVTSGYNLSTCYPVQPEPYAKFNQAAYFQPSVGRKNMKATKITPTAIIV